MHNCLIWIEIICIFLQAISLATWKCHLQKLFFGHQFFYSDIGKLHFAYFMNLSESYSYVSVCLSIFSPLQSFNITIVRLI